MPEQVEELYEFPAVEPEDMGRERRVPGIMTKMHRGQHGPGCFPCKLSSLHFGNSEPASHVVNGNPWKDNPVVDRIQELSGGQIEINTDIPRAQPS